MVERKGALKPVGSHVSAVPLPADVVHQDIDPRQTLKDLLGQPPHLRLRRHVRDQHIHLPAAGSTDRASPVFGALGAPANDRDPRLHPGQA
jgi:hypothetical protein